MAQSSHFFFSSLRYTCTASMMLVCSVAWFPGAPSVTRMYSFSFTTARLASHRPAAIKYIGLLESPSPRKIDAMILYAVMHGTPIKQMIR